MTWFPVAKLGEVRAGDVVAVTVADTEIALGRDGDRLFAVQRVCLHQGGDLANGIVVARSPGLPAPRLAILDRDRMPRYGI